jgi:hypothetical protein
MLRVWRETVGGRFGGPSSRMVWGCDLFCERTPQKTRPVCWQRFKPTMQIAESDGASLLMSRALERRVVIRFYGDRVLNWNGPRFVSE